MISGLAPAPEAYCRATLKLNNRDIKVRLQYAPIVKKTFNNIDLRAMTLTNPQENTVQALIIREEDEDNFFSGQKIKGELTTNNLVNKEEKSESVSAHLKFIELITVSFS